MGVAEDFNASAMLLDAGVEPDRVAGAGADEDPFGAVFVGSADIDAAFAGLLFGFRGCGVGVGVVLGGVDDLVQPDGVSDRPSARPACRRTAAASSVSSRQAVAILRARHGVALPARTRAQMSGKRWRSASAWPM